VFPVEVDSLVLGIVEVQPHRERVLGRADLDGLARPDTRPGGLEEQRLPFGYRKMPQIGANESVEQQVHGVDPGAGASAPDRVGDYYAGA
jgi:hypothetical protein